MTNPTSNFGWQMPTSTDLVTDLPADFEVFGQAVDTSLADLKGGTTGQVLKKNTNADMDFVWGADSAGMTNPMTTTGDTIYSSSGSTPARLGIGSTGQVLTVSGGVPTWAAASAADQNWSLVSTTATTSGTSVTITGLGTYKQLMIFFNRLSAASFSDQWYLQFNSSASANYNDFGLRAGGTTQFNGNRNVNGTELPIGGSADAADSMTGYLYVSGCQSTGFKFGNYTAGATTPVTNNISQIKGFIWANAATISSIKVAGYDSRTFDNGEIIIYGSTN